YGTHRRRQRTAGRSSCDPKKPVPAWQRPWYGVAASLRPGSRRRRHPGCRAGATRRQRNRRRSDGGRSRAGIAAHRPGRRRALLRLFARFRQLHRPCPLPPGIHLKKPAAVIAARQAVADTADREFLVTGTHIGLTHPFAAVIVIYGVDIVI